MLPFPILDNDELAKLIHIDDDGELPASSRAGRSSAACTRSPAAAWRCSGRSTRSAREVQQGDRRRRPHHRAVATATPTRSYAPIPSLLLTAAVHHHLIREKHRTQVGLVVECGDAREVHHMALLIGYGAGAINPYLAFESHRGHDRRGPARSRRDRPAQGGQELHQGRRQGRAEGDVARWASRTVATYTGAQIFEAIGLGQDAGRRVLHRHGQPPRRHRPRRGRRRGRRPPRRGLPATGPSERAHRELELGGEYQWRREGEYHLFNPETVFKLQHATRTRRYDIFKEYTAAGRRPGEAARHAARPVRVQDRRAPAGADRRGRAGRARSSSGSPPAR